MSEVALPPVIPAAPRVAVIVPAYGVAHLVGEALDSLLAQTMPDWECVVIDDGAPDDVAGAVAPYLGDPRIRFLATGNHGVSGARNTAIAATTAPYIALLDGDDRFRPDYLARTTARLDADPSLCLATVNAHIFGAVPRERLCFEDKQGSTDGLHGTLAEVLDRSFGVYIGTTFRRSDYERTAGFDTSFTHCEDFDMWVQLMQLGGRAGYVDEVLGEYRVRVDSASASREKMLRGNLRVYDKAVATLPVDAPERALAQRLARETQQAIDFEHAMDRVIDGDTAGGLAALRSTKEQVTGLVWTLSFALWTLFPSLARPMLAWRRRKHSRGGSEAGLKTMLQSIAP
ncbi:MAG: glycosyltransferase family 2 protein [Novosphingobium sp.]